MFRLSNIQILIYVRAVHLFLSTLNATQSLSVSDFLAVAQAKSRSWKSSDNSLENHGLSQPFTLKFLIGACLFMVFKNKVWKCCHAVVTSGIKNSLSQSDANNSCRNPWVSNILKLLFIIILGFALGILQFLIVTTVQWSLTSSGKIPVRVYLWGLFVSMISIKVDLLGFLWLGHVGDSISWVRFTESQYALNWFENNQFQFKSPSNTRSLESRSVKAADSEVKASLTAEGGL